MERHGGRPPAGALPARAASRVRARAQTEAAVLCAEDGDGRCLDGAPSLLQAVLPFLASPDGSPLAGEYSRARVGSIRPENHDYFRENWMCSVLLSEDPPEHISARFRFASMAVRWGYCRRGRGTERQQPHGTHGGFSRRPGDREQSTSHILPVETETGA